MMSEGSAKELQEPDPWDRYEGDGHKWENIRMKEVVYSDLPRGACDTIRSVIAVPECKGDKIDKIHRLDAQTIEIVYYNDGKDRNKHHTTVSDRYLERLRDLVQAMFGEHWRVERKEWEEDWSDHPQRFLLRRADHQRFRYQGESEGSYYRNLYGLPEGVPEDAGRWGDLDRFEKPRGATSGGLDFYVYGADTGTLHLLHGTVRQHHPARPVRAMCGYDVPGESMVDGDVYHYADVIAYADESLDSLDPQSLLGDHLCGSCWKHYARTKKRRDGTVRGYVPPTHRYGKLRRGWPHE